VIHIESGNYLWIVTDRRGETHERLFLPFADASDAKADEVISKILLLLEDDKIQDPSIVSQIKSERQSPQRHDFFNGCSSMTRTYDLRVMSKDPESVPFVRRALQTPPGTCRTNVSQTDERWLLLARHAAVPQGDFYS
jgi:hypothetical protein